MRLRNLALYGMFTSLRVLDSQQISYETQPPQYTTHHRLHPAWHRDAPTSPGMEWRHQLDGGRGASAANTNLLSDELVQPAGVNLVHVETVSLQ